jgi:hypothetical protein
VPFVNAERSTFPPPNAKDGEDYFCRGAARSVISRLKASRARALCLFTAQFGSPRRKQLILRQVLRVYHRRLTC